MGVGIGYSTPKNDDWFRNAEARVTVNKYWMVLGETGRQTQRSRIGLFAQVRDMNRLDFFGLGPDTRRRDRTDFALRETSVGIRGWARATELVRLGGSAQFYSPERRRGQSPLVPSIEQMFSADAVPGLNEDPDFARYRGYVELVYPVLANPSKDTQLDDRFQGTYQLAVESVRDLRDGTFNFYRVETEIQERFAGFKPGHRLTLHGLVSLTNPDGLVPFYLQYALGGGGGLSAFRPNTIGTDGTKGTLRAFHNYRFRDRDILLMQAEYRVALRQDVHASIFADAGRVAPTASTLFQGGLKAGTVFSLSYMRKGAALARLDVGYGASEGIHLLWSFGGFFQQ